VKGCCCCCCCGGGSLSGGGGGREKQGKEGSVVVYNEVCYALPIDIVAMFIRVLFVDSIVIVDRRCPRYGDRGMWVQ